MNKYTFDPKIEELSLFQLKTIVVLITTFVLKNKQIPENKIPKSIKKHFKKVII